MAGFWIVIGFIFYLKVSRPLIKMLHLKSSCQTDIIYTLSGLLAAGVLLYINYAITSKSSVVVMAFYFVVLLSQILYWYFKRPSQTNAVK